MCILYTILYVVVMLSFDELLSEEPDADPAEGDLDSDLTTTGIAMPLGATAKAASMRGGGLSRAASMRGGGLSRAASMRGGGLSMKGKSGSSVGLSSKSGNFTTTTNSHKTGLHDKVIITKNTVSMELKPRELHRRKSTYTATRNSILQSAAPGRSGGGDSVGKALLDIQKQSQAPSGTNTEVGPCLKEPAGGNDTVDPSPMSAPSPVKRSLSSFFTGEAAPVAPATPPELKKLKDPSSYIYYLKSGEFLFNKPLNSLVGAPVCSNIRFHLKYHSNTVYQIEKKIIKKKETKNDKKRFGGLF